MRLGLHLLAIHFFFLHAGIVTMAQNPAGVDSLLGLLETPQADTIRVKTLLSIANKYIYVNPDTAIYYGNRALEQANLAKWKKGVMLAHLNMGISERNRSNYSVALEHNEKALVLALETNNHIRAAGAYGAMGTIHWYQGDYPKTLELFLKALKLSEEHGTKKDIAPWLGNIGNLHLGMGEHEKALEIYLRALKLYREMDAKSNIAVSLGNIGQLHHMLGDEHKALEYYEEALELSRKINNKLEIAKNLGNMGTSYIALGDDEKALKYSLEALAINKETGRKRGISIVLGNLGPIYARLGKFQEAERYMLEALELAKEINIVDSQNSLHKNLSDLYADMGQYQKALEHHIQYSITKDSIFNNEKSQEIGKLEASAEYDKQLAVQKAEQEKKDAIAAEQLQSQKQVNYLFMGGFGLVLIVVFVIFRSLRIKRRANLLLEEKNLTISGQKQDLTDSIEYGQRIQEAVLPAKEVKLELFPDAFVLLLPRDIVSGDFYWFGEKDGKKLIAAVDCTGHGVPGAFMSILGNAYLNQIVMEEGITSPGNILDALKEKVARALKQTGSIGEARDGMDIAILAFSNDNSQVEYAGAYNPLYHLCNGEITETRGSRQPIGFMKEREPFINHSIDLQKGDMLYIFTDGYADQFGGPKGKKFKYQPFKELLLTLQELPMLEQEEKLRIHFDQWKGERDQTDDVCVIGVRV